MRTSKPIFAALAALLLAACGTTRPQLSPEEEMAVWQAYGTPGPHHERMLAEVGAWEAEMTFWETPDAEAQTSPASSTLKPILNGLFVQENFRGAFWGQPFQGLGLQGYDNAADMHVSLWLDSMSSGVYRAVGECSDECRVIEWVGSGTDPIDGSPLPSRMRTTVVSDDEMMMEMWGPDHDGEFFKMMEIRYTRT